MENKVIPTIEDLKKGVELTPLKKLLETDPVKEFPEWLKELQQKNAKGEAVKYLPIERVDYLLRSIFSSFWWEVTGSQVYQNSIQVTGRLFYVNPETKRVEHTDGIGGAMSRQGLETAAPIAEANAKKSAAKKLGKIFGRDLSRDEVEAEALKPNPEEVKEDISVEVKKMNPVTERILKQIEKTKTSNALQKVNQTVINYYKDGEIEDSDLDLITKELNTKISNIKK